MRVIITGGTGFIGTALCGHLLAHGHEVAVITRSPSAAANTFGRGVMALDWQSPIAADLLAGGAAMVNLAGENIASGRWTAAKKRRIRHSRLAAGQAIVELADKAGRAPDVLIQASAVGYYGPRGEELIDETAGPGQGFLAEVAQKWEYSTEPLERRGTRRCVIRSGVVLGHGGALARMLPAFRLWLGGPMGSGEQGVSWIHLHDEIRAIAHLLENDDSSGAYNLCAPNPASSARFAKTLGKALNRPAWLRAPAWALSLLLGQMADEALLSGQFCLPKRLLAEGFVFEYPMLDVALVELLVRRMA